MARLFLIDTTVVVGGVLGFGDGAAPPPSASPVSPSALIVRAMLDGRLPFIVSADLLAEYRLALLRPTVAERLRLAPWGVGVLLAELATAAYLRQPRHALAPDRDDRPPRVPAAAAHVISLLAEEPRAALVSGDGGLIAAVRGWREALTPAELVEAENLGAADEV